MGAERSRAATSFGLDTLVNSTGFALLSPRENDVLRRASAGMIDKEIGVEMGVTMNTLRSYWGRIRGKVGEAPRAAIVAGFVEGAMRAEAETRKGVSLQEDWILDLRTDLLTASDSINDLHGLERGVAHPRLSYAQHYHPEDQPKIRASFDHALKGNDDTHHMTFRLVLPSGIENVSLLILVERDEEGTPIRWHGHRLRTFDCRPDSED